jgi:hypothetical protein
MLTDRFESTAMVTEHKETGARRLSLLVGIVAGEAYSIYATFFAHVLTPATVYAIDRYTHRRLLPGQIGDLVEVFNWDGLIPILVFSLIAFALVWCITSITAKYARQFRRQTVAPSEEIHSAARTVARNRTAIA